ncbi:hypothetical protein N7G274_009566 [Stereocaulon virgatum]|uniref:t-SNARE coiled-coil homology domain-containing protein n=1 Tax=Stereocaulon virgatum TaxID=373712 RepID=A0ABR3ZY32_9LECA
MVIPWCVGASDFVAVAKLTGKVISELKEDVIVELGFLEHALSRLYELEPGKHELNHLDTIRAAATACKRPLEDFLEMVSKFDKSLGTWDAKEKRSRAIGRRLQFNMAFEKEVKNPRITLTSHVSTINMLLMTQTLRVHVLVAEWRRKTLELTTAAETVRAEDTMRFEDTHRMIPGRLKEVDIEQKRNNEQIREGLEALQEKADPSASRDDRIQIGLVDQDKTMRSIEADILQIQDRTDEIEKAKPISNAANGFDVSLSALDIMSRVFALAVSGVMVVSA